MTKATVVIAVCVLCASSCVGARAPAPGRYLAAWSGDADRHQSDFLAIVDIDSSSPGYGTVVASVPAAAVSTEPHHMEYAYTPGRSLFASGWSGHRMFRFDVSHPLAPRLLGEVQAPPGFNYAHSFARLPDGDVLATMQGDDSSDDGPGGLVRFHDDGMVVASASAAVPGVKGARLRPYSLIALPAENRVISASATMDLEAWNPHAAAVEHAMMEGDIPNTAQLWELTPFRLLATVALDAPQVKSDSFPACAKVMLTCPPGLLPMEPRLLADGRTAMVSTELCGLFRLSGLDSGTFRADYVYRFEGVGCSVPLRIGHYWLEAVIGTSRVVVLDIADPMHPVEVSRVQFAPDENVHWISADADGRRIAVTHVGTAEQRIWLLRFNPATGAIAMDSSFHDPGTRVPGVSFKREHWPHGETGPAIPHGVVFLP